MQFGDSSDYMIKLMELGSIHKSKEGVFEMTSDNGGRLETLHLSNPLSRTFVTGSSDFVLIDGTHKTNIYDLSLIVTTVVDSVGKIYPTWISAGASVKDLYDMNDHTFIVWDINNKPNTWRVYYVDDKPPECECGIFISTKIRLNKLQ